MPRRYRLVCVFFSVLLLCLVFTLTGQAQQVAPPQQGAAPQSAPAAQPAAPSGPKKRVAVLNFDYATVMTEVAAVFGTNQDVGKGISDLLVTKLVQDGQYSVIERNAIDKILNEQNFANSDRVDPSSAAKIGRILGVDAVIMGTITQFGRDDKNTSIGAGAASVTRKFGIGGFSSKNSKAVVGVTARLVDTSTAEILAAVTGTGESKRSGTAVLGAGGGGGGAGGAGVDMGTSNFAQTIIGEAVHAAVDSVGQQLDEKASGLPTRKVEYSGVVADASGNTLILNVGRTVGVHVGDVIEISRPVRTVKDPTTGKVLKTITSTLGTAKVTDVDDGSCTATFTGTGPVKVGDVAKSQQQ